METGRDTELTDTGKLSEEREILMKDLDTRIVVQVTLSLQILSSHNFRTLQNFDTRVKTQRAPEMASLTCSDLLTAYRLSQSLNRNRQRPYKYDPAETMDLHRY